MHNDGYININDFQNHKFNLALHSNLTPFQLFFRKHSFQQTVIPQSFVYYICTHDSYIWANKNIKYSHFEIKNY